MQFIYDFIEKILPAKFINFVPVEGQPSDEMGGTKLEDPNGNVWMVNRSGVVNRFN